MSIKTAGDYAALAESELRDAWEEVRREHDPELAEWSFRAAAVYATLAVAASQAATFREPGSVSWAQVKAVRQAGER